MKRIYLDYNASTPIDPAVATAMNRFLEDHYGNPSSGHWASAEAKAALDLARGQVAALLDCHNDEIVFTSGASEANNQGSVFCSSRQGRPHHHHSDRAPVHHRTLPVSGTSGRARNLSAG